MNVLPDQRQQFTPTLVMVMEPPITRFVPAHEAFRIGVTHSLMKVARPRGDPPNKQEYGHED
jgi:hypothetical protein